MEVAIDILLKTPTVTVQDVRRQGNGRHQVECACTMHLVFPDRYVYVRHLGCDRAVAEANQVLFSNPSKAYRMSHPVVGGNACLDLVLDEALQRELTPTALLRDGAALGFRQQCLCIDARAQALFALLILLDAVGKQHRSELGSKVANLTEITDSKGAFLLPRERV